VEEALSFISTTSLMYRQEAAGGHSAVQRCVAQPSIAESPRA
jgi:hypothetical protein